MRNAIRSVFSMVGLDIRLKRNIPLARQKQKHDDLITRWRLLGRYQPKTILDVGANEGQCAQLLREAFPHARIYSFEPLKDCYSKVSDFLSKNGPGKAFQCALGNENGTQTMHRNDFTPSSSILPMQELHVVEYPHTDKSTPEQIEIRRLDDLIHEIDVEYPLVIKADVQGYEGHVIKGGEEVFRRASAAVLELTSYPLYEGQATFESVTEQLAGLDYQFRGIVDQSPSPVDGRILQFDGLYENTALIPESAIRESAVSSSASQGADVS